MEKGFIKNILAVIIVLFFLFFSQQPEYRKYGKNLYGQAMVYGQSWWQGASSYAENTLFPLIGGEVDKRKDNAEQEIQQEKSKISENVWQKTKNYFSDIILNVLKIFKLSEKEKEASSEPASGQ